MESPDVDQLVDALREAWLTENDLSFLRTLPIDTLVRLHTEVKEHEARVHEGERRLYQVMANTTRFVPNFVLAKLAGSLSAYVLAQITAYLDAKAAASLAKSFDAHLLGEIALHLDTAHAAAIATHVDLETLVEITDSLARKGLYRRLGEVSDALDSKMLEKLVARVGDESRVAEIAAHMHDIDKLAAISARLDKKLRAAVAASLERLGHAARARAVRG